MTQSPQPNKEFSRFEELTKRLLRVPKKEIDQKEKERPVVRRKAKKATS